MLLKKMQNAKKLSKTMDNAHPINPEKTLGLSVIYSVPTGLPVEGPNATPFVTDQPTDPPTQWTFNNGAPVNDSGRQN